MQSALTARFRFAAAFALRQRMLNFVQNIQYYMMFEVMEPTWHIMETNLKTVIPPRPRHTHPFYSHERSQLFIV